MAFIGEIRVTGTAEVEESLLNLGRAVQVGMQPALIEAATPIAADAAQLAFNEIANMDGRWSRMKVGATAKTVYVAPKSRRRGGSPRRNLAILLLTKAMQPAVEAHENEVVAKLTELVEAAKIESGL